MTALCVQGRAAVILKELKDLGANCKVCELGDSSLRLCLVQNDSESVQGLCLVQNDKVGMFNGCQRRRQREKSGAFVAVNKLIVIIFS